MGYKMNIAPQVPGYYKRSLQGHRTFIPDPLPPNIELTPAVSRSVEKATHLLGQVEMCRTLLPNSELLIYSSLRREALASSTIEGTIASPDELVRYQASNYQERASERSAVREVANYSVALETGCEQIKTLPIASRLILNLHEILLHDVRGGFNAGRYKDRQNRIGSDPSEPFEAAVFVPPAPEDTVKLMADLERYINSENNEAQVVQCALTHYQFETIHPFNDGNGRVGRLLIILQLMQLGLLSAPLVYPSVYFERTRQEYYQRLQDVREKSAWNEWIEYFAKGIQYSCSDTLAFTQVILQLRKELQERISSVRKRASLGEVMNVFFYDPIRTMPEIGEQTHLAPNTIQSALNALKEMGFVYEVSHRQRNRVYACAPILDAIYKDHPPETGPAQR